MENNKDSNKLVSLVSKIGILNGWHHLPNKLNDILFDYFRYKITGITPATDSSHLYDND